MAGEAELERLAERLEAATGPDRELDAEIMFDLFAKPVGQRDDGGPAGYLWIEDNPSWNFGIRFPGKERAWFSEARRKIDGETLVIERDGACVLMNSLRIPKITASLDAALTLVETQHEAIGAHALDTLGEALGDMLSSGWHPNQPTAPQLGRRVCLALVRARALIAKEQTDAG